MLRLSPTCEGPAKFGDGHRTGQTSIVTLTCSQPPDLSDEWLEYLARATGGWAFSGGKFVGVKEYDAEGRLRWGQYRLESDHGLVSDALRFAVDESRYWASTFRNRNWMARFTR
jgi:hypothetical protein